jgi:hypothetical protein
MAEPTEKSPEIDNFLKNELGIDRKESISADKCATCGKDVTIEVESGKIDDFRDNESRHEYRISGMCQECQDSVFGV